MKKLLFRLAAVLLAFSLLVLPASALTTEQALELLEMTYLRDIPEEAYDAQSLDELFALLGDPYTYYMDAEEYAAFLAAVEGDEELVGVGVSVQFTEQGILVVNLVEGGSAQEEGILPGDLIVAVDGVSCVPGTESDRNLLLGDEGSQVTVSVVRDGAMRDYTLTRRHLVVINTRLEMIDGRIGSIDCDSFGSETSAYFSDAIESAVSESNPQLWLIDLRDNGGGYTNAAVESLGLFAGRGTYMYLMNGRDTVTRYTYLQNAVTNLPVITLINGNTASASEAFAAGIRDNLLGITVGSRTYGKGVAQIVCDESVFDDYFDGDAVKITAYRFYSGRGNTTDQIGAIPTLLVDDEIASEVAAALCGPQDETAAGSLKLRLDHAEFYLDTSVEPAALSALLEALPPSAGLFLNTDGGVWVKLAPVEVASRLGMAYNSRWFDDVLTSPYRDEINTLGTYGLMVGDGDGRFRPAEQLTRAEFCAMLARLLRLSDPGPSRFSDVPDGTWYAEPVNALAAQGLVEGMGDGTFQPEGPLTQEQFLALMARLACYLNFAVDSYSQALDVKTLNSAKELTAFPSDWSKRSAAVLAWGAQATLGAQEDMLYAPLSSLEPQANVLREEAAAGLYAVLAVLGYIPA